MKLTASFLAIRAISVISLAASVLSTPSFGAEPVSFDRIEGSTIYFKNENGKELAKPVKTDVHDLRYLGALTHPNNSAYFLFAGRPCAECVQMPTLYVFKPTGRVTTFVYPGRVLDHKTRALVLESRAFVGRCLPRERGDVYVVFQREKVDRRNHLQPSVFIAQAGPDYIEEKLLERNFPRLNDTLRLVKSKTCREIEGKHRISLVKPLDLTPRRESDTEGDDEDDTPTKENQTDKELPSSSPES